MENSWKNKIAEMKGDKISIKNACEELCVLLDKYEWFYDSLVEDRAITVYVTHMNKDVMDLVPCYLYGYHIKLAFSGYLLCGEKYGKNLKTSEVSDIDTPTSEYEVD